MTAGIDFGFILLQELTSPSFAASIQLALEYDPHPPFPRVPHPDVKVCWNGVSVLCFPFHFFLDRNLRMIDTRIGLKNFAFTSSR